MIILKKIFPEYETRQQLSEEVIRILTGLMMLGGGIIISSSDRYTGIALLIREFATPIGFDVYILSLVLFGIILIFYRKASVRMFLILSTPILIYIGYGLGGFILGKWAFQGIYFLLMLYGILLAAYWGYNDD